LTQSLDIRTCFTLAPRQEAVEVALRAQRHLKLEALGSFWEVLKFKTKFLCASSSN